jgi:glutaredoxin 3
MARIEIYTTTICPYCVRAKTLLKKKGAAYEEINIETDDALRQTMMDRTGGRRTVPQIFIDGRHVGGCDDLYALDRQGELDRLLGLAA